MHPHHKGKGGDSDIPLPRLIAWEVTRSCKLDCVHCRAAARFGPYENELATEECLRLLDDVASFAQPIMILTGGDPLLRQDIFQIARYGTDLGLRMVMSPNGTSITGENAKKMVESGIQRVSISLDGPNAETHDAFRQVSGAFEGAMRGIEYLKEAGLEFQINTTVTKHNIHLLEEIHRLAYELGAVAFDPFLLVPVGRGKNIIDQEISPQQYEELLEWLYDQRKKVPLHIKVTCGPHYYRVLRQRAKKEGIKLTFETHGLEAVTKGCMGGQTFAFISHTGEVQICGYLEVKCGDIRQQSFKEVWFTSPVFKQMRALDEYKGRCGYCEYRAFCGGCRARAYEVLGDYLQEEPFCIYQPKAGKKMQDA